MEFVWTLFFFLIGIFFFSFFVMESNIFSRKKKIAYIPVFYGFVSIFMILYSIKEFLNYITQSA